MSIFDLPPSAGLRDPCYLCHAEVGNYPSLQAFAHTTAGKTHYVHLTCFNTLTELLTPGSIVTCVCNTSIPQDRWNAFTNVFRTRVTNNLALQTQHQEQLHAAVTVGDIETIRRLTQGGHIPLPIRMQQLRRSAPHPKVIPLLLQHIRIPPEYASDFAELSITVVYYRTRSNPDDVLAALAAILATGLISESIRCRLIDLMINVKYYEIIPKFLPLCQISDIAKWRLIFKHLNTANEETLEAFFKSVSLSFENFKKAVESVEEERGLSIN